jgi:hypothetical protein
MYSLNSIPQNNLINLLAFNTLAGDLFNKAVNPHNILKHYIYVVLKNGNSRKVGFRNFENTAYA